MNNESNPDFTQDAAHHLREKARKKGLEIGSSHAHALVAASLGYKSRAALLADDSNHYLGDPLLFREVPDMVQIGEAIERMRETTLTQANVPFLASTIQDGLTPPCTESGIRSVQNIPLGTDQPDENTQWVHPSVAHDQNEFGHCVCCGNSIFYRLDDLDSNGLCEEHHGEFDLDPEEQQDFDDKLEYLTKDQ